MSYIFITWKDKGIDLLRFDDGKLPVLLQPADLGDAHAHSLDLANALFCFVFFKKKDSDLRRRESGSTGSVSGRIWPRCSRRISWYACAPILCSLSTDTLLKRRRPKYIRQPCPPPNVSSSSSHTRHRHSLQMRHVVQSKHRHDACPREPSCLRVLLRATVTSTAAGTLEVLVLLLWLGRPAHLEPRATDRCSTCWQRRCARLRGCKGNAAKRSRACRQHVMATKLKTTHSTPAHTPYKLYWQVCRRLIFCFQQRRMPTGTLGTPVAIGLGSRSVLFSSSHRFSPRHETRAPGRA